MPRIEFALLIIGVFVLIIGIIFGYAMIHEYRVYLDDHYKARYSFRDFIKRERFYIYLFFASIFIMLINLLYFLNTYYLGNGINPTIGNHPTDAYPTGKSILSHLPPSLAA